MAKIPYTRIDESDYKDPEVRKLARNLASQLTAIVNSYNNGMSSDNFVEQEFTLNVYIPQDSSTYSPYPISFTWQYAGYIPKECQITKIKATDNSRSVLSGVNPPDWEFDGNRILIHAIPGNLVGNKTYSVTFKTKG